MARSKAAAWYALIVLFAINTANFFDRLILGAVGEPVRKEFGLGDASLGLLATAFTLLYAFVGLPFGRLADIAPRKYILSAGVFLWSLMTAGTGLAQSVWQVFLMRLGVGVGEASCAPAATSLIAELNTKEHRTKAMSIIMLGLPLGIGLSFAVSGSIAQAYGWRMAFLAAGIPGILLAIACLFLVEPRSKPGPVAAAIGSGRHDVKNSVARGSDTYRQILASPTMRWIILSGVIHNFCLYTLSSFMTPYMMRWHGLAIRDASLNSMLINGVFTLPGLLFGGFIGDAVKRRKADGGLLLAAFASLAAVPLLWIAVSATQTDVMMFVVGMGGAIALMYFYYSNVYAAIQDLVEPQLRGSAMAVYFFAMYLLGGALGPYATGALSDYFTRRAAATAGAAEAGQAALEPFRAAGLHNAMFLIPVLAIALAIVLFAASRAMLKESETNAD